MRRVLMAVMTVLLLLPAAPTAFAGGDGNRMGGCVTKAEYKRVKPGFRKARVHRIFGTPGTRLGLGANEIRSYVTCASGGFVQVTYNHRGRVLAKAGSWVTLSR